MICKANNSFLNHLNTIKNKKQQVIHPHLPKGKKKMRAQQSHSLIPLSIILSLFTYASPAPVVQTYSLKKAPQRRFHNTHHRPF